jgi:zinc transport system substrate-binding protein
MTARPTQTTIEVIAMKRQTAAAMLCLAGFSAQAEVPNVVTDIPPVHALVAQVMAGLGAPELLVTGGSDAHSFQLRPSQAATLGEADLLFWIGPEMTPWLDRALAGDFAGKPVALLQAPGTFVRHYGESEGHDHDDHEGEDHEDEAHQDGQHAGHDHEGADPHAWLDPGNAVVWLDRIAADLAAADPDNAETYAANRDAAKAGVIAVEADMRAAFLDAGAPIVVFHDAYGYLADHFGLDIAGAIAEGDAAEPGAAHLSALAGAITEKGVRCIFAEAGHDPAAPLIPKARC